MSRAAAARLERSVPGWWTFGYEHMRWMRGGTEALRSRYPKICAVHVKANCLHVR